MSYLFKDTDLAARRLKLLAEVFAVGSRPFMRDAVMLRPQLAVDLGCGPGYTTRLLAEMTQASRVVGVDSSEHFIELAGARADERVAFVCHDVTKVPFPVGQSEVMFCRMLLTHLQRPLELIESWGTQLSVGGVMLLEEVEWIRTEVPELREYLGIVAAMLEQQQNQLYIGPMLDQQQPRGGLKRRMSRVYPFYVATKDAAAMFFMNIQNWKGQSFIRERYAEAEIVRLEEALGRLAAEATGINEIEWEMRQIVYERGGPAHEGAGLRGL